MKKTLNLFAVVALVASLFAPLSASAASLTISATVANLSKNETTWSASTNAAPGENVVYSVAIANPTSSTVSGIVTRVVLPAELQYVSNSGKVTYKDAAGATQTTLLPDYLFGTSGSTLPDLGAQKGLYVSYKVKVAANAATKTVAAVNQVTANGGTSLTTSTGVVNITGNSTPAPAPTPAPQPSVSKATLNSSVYNVTKGETAYAASTNANRGDDIIYRMAVGNVGTGALTNVVVRAVLPTGLVYQPGYAKLYYKENGVNNAMALSDAIATSNGVTLRDIPYNSGVYVTYKVRVADNASYGTKAIVNQMTANGGVSLTDNMGLVKVAEANIPTPTPPTPCCVTPGTAKATLNSSVYNVTKGETAYAASTNANRGDDIIYRMAVGNVGTGALTNVVVRTKLPAGLVYQPGYAKLYYKENGQNHAMALSDAIATDAGVTLHNIPYNDGVYVTYKVRVADNAPLSALAAVQQMTANGGVSLTDNMGLVYVVDGVEPTPTPGPVVTSALSIYATAYNKTTGTEGDYKNYVTAKRGDTLHFRVIAKNAGSTDLNGVSIASILPADMSFVDGSAKVVRTPGNAEVSPIGQTTAIGTLTPGQGTAIEFDAVVNEDTDNKVTALSYKATISATGVAKKTATVTVNLGLGGAQELPNSGTPGTMWAIGLLAAFLAIAAAIYSKETGLYQRALAAIRR